ncbi:CRISPR-associated protein Cas4 [Anaerocolumna xylanovorans]|uniref:CRISPR-associated exonuclease Cas4 n=1 Tax=Anaerocolumna xylanovorans DSM 12503 TaxID=1121345 RepID=A0A1M7YD40_9FIRM|nr:CRISPR-associated protein Cas4 [Anaerocolumna xylanovorans]SHO50572.1 CRISPR-associated exonuclease, Cas4 family [Anaerocolumna xylanovorans DSM 12503]
MEDFKVTGTFIWYYCICKREVWLLAHGMEADQQDENMQMGNAIHETSYKRDSKEVEFAGSKFDVISKENGKLIVGEIKKSSKYLESAKMQLLFYLMELEESGIYAEGELLFPEEKKKETVILTEDTRKQLKQVIEDIKRIAVMPLPMMANRIKYCKNCAYSEFCWS